MSYGICNLSIVPLRAEPAHRSEMTSQLLFGECFEVAKQEGEWSLIHTAFDQYEGWIQTAQFHPIAFGEYQELQKSTGFLSYDLVQILLENQYIFSVVLGSALPWFYNNTCRIGLRNFAFEGNARQPEPMPTAKNLIENAYMYLNSPYLWGGRSPFGIDCSGFTQMVFKLSGMKLRRDAWMQAEQGYTINLLDESATGDLVFFDNDDGKIIHTGILIAKNKVIHASGRVRIDNIDHHGIFNAEQKRYSHNLRLIRRII